MSDISFRIPQRDLVQDDNTRKEKILAILAKGKAARFSLASGASKDVKEWNEDDSGDLLAFRTQKAFNPYVCWRGNRYEISEVDI